MSLYHKILKENAAPRREFYEFRPGHNVLFMPAAESVPWRNTHLNAYTFSLIERGTVRFKINTFEVEAREGSLLISTPMTWVEALELPEGYMASNLFVDRRIFESLPTYGQFVSTLMRMRGNCLALDRQQSAHMRQTMHIFRDYLAMPGHAREPQEALLTQFMTLQVLDYINTLHPRENALPTRRESLIIQFFTLLAEESRIDHGLEYYADRMNISKAYLSRIIREGMGRTPFHYISERIYFMARELLRQTDMTVMQISDSLGFSDQSAFGAFIRARSGLSPTALRRAPDDGQTITF